MHLMNGETGAGIGLMTMDKNLEKDREYEKILLKLRQEFTEIDINQD